MLVGNALSKQDKDIVAELSVSNSKIRLFLTDIRFLTFSLNLGLNHCQGELVLRMDADDISYPNRIEKLVNFMQLHPDVAVCGSAYYLIDDNDNKQKEIKVPITDYSIRRTMYLNNPICHPSVIFRKNVIEKFGGYMGGLYAEDYDLWCRMALDKSIKFANLEEKLLGYRSTPTGVARRSKFAYAAMAAVQLRSFVLTGNPFWLISTIISMVKRLIFANR